MVTNWERTLLGIMVRSQGTTPLCRVEREVSFSGKRVSFQYNGRASGAPIYLDTEVVSQCYYKVRLAVAKD